MVTVNLLESQLKTGNIYTKQQEIQTETNTFCNANNMA